MLVVKVPKVSPECKAGGPRRLRAVGAAPRRLRLSVFRHAQPAQSGCCWLEHPGACCQSAWAAGLFALRAAAHPRERPTLAPWAPRRAFSVPGDRAPSSGRSPVAPVSLSPVIPPNTESPRPGVGQQRRSAARDSAPRAYTSTSCPFSQASEVTRRRPAWSRLGPREPLRCAARQPRYVRRRAQCLPSRPRAWQPAQGPPAHCGRARRSEAR